VLGPLIRMRARQLSRHLKDNQLSRHRKGNQLSRYQKDNQPQLPEQPVAKLAASHSKSRPRMILQPQRQSSASKEDRQSPTASPRPLLPNPGSKPSGSNPELKRRTNPVPQQPRMKKSLCKVSKPPGRLYLLLPVSRV
jgi:hypothetical protein